MQFEKFCAALSAIVVGSALLVLLTGLNISTNYSDFIVGNLAWSGGSKTQDLIAWPLFIFISFLAYCVASKSLSWLRINQGSDSSEQLSGLICWCSMPFCVGLAAIFLGHSIDNRLIYLSAIGNIFLTSIAFVNSKLGRKYNPSYVGTIFLCVIMSSLIPIELLLLLGRAPISLVGNINSGFFETATYFTFFLGLVIGAIASVKNIKLSKTKLSTLVLCAQLGLPLFYLTLYPARLLLPSGELTKHDTTIYLRVLIVTLIVIGIYDVVKRFRKHLNSDNWSLLLSPVAIFGLVFAIKSGTTIPPIVSPDDYHFGESLLGWWSYLNGVVPYVGYIPAHGLVDDDFRLFISYVFYDGTAGSVFEAGRLSLGILGLVAFLSLYRLSGSIALAVTSILFLEGRLAWFFFIPFICLWISPSLRTNPGKWVSVWIITVPIVVLGVPAQGVLLVAAFCILAGKIILDQFSLGDKESWITISLVSVLLLVVSIFTPVLYMLMGALSYVLENGPINQVAYGIPWSLSWTSNQRFGIVFEVIRMSWVVTPLLCFFLIARRWHEFRMTQDILYPAIAFLLFVLLLIPYSMGRIDPGSVSRSGLVSIFCWAVICPVLLWGVLKFHCRSLLLLLIAFMSSLLGYNNLSYNRVLSAASPNIATPPLRDSASFGLANIGRAHVTEEHWHRIISLHKLLGSELQPGEAYLDLTSRNAMYFYENRLPPVPVTAPYNLVSLSQQKQLVEILDNPPKIALLEADNIIQDGGGLALRNPILFRFIIDNYTARYEDGFIVGLRKSEFDSESNGIIDAKIENITDSNWDSGIGRDYAAVVLSDPFLVSVLNVDDRIKLGNGEFRRIKKVLKRNKSIWFEGEAISKADLLEPDEIRILSHPKVLEDYQSSLFQKSFSPTDLKKIPVSWGRSEAALAEKMSLVSNLDGESISFNHLEFEEGKYTVVGSEPSITIDTSNLELSGRNSGLLRLDFTCHRAAGTPLLKILWWGGYHNSAVEGSGVMLEANDGTLIIPVDASSWWITLRKVNAMKIELVNSASCTAISIDNIGLYQRIF